MVSFGSLKIFFLFFAPVLIFFTAGLLSLVLRARRLIGSVSHPAETGLLIPSGKLHYQTCGFGSIPLVRFRRLPGSCRESARCVALGLMPTYLRFVIAEIHESSAKELGVFHAVLRLREEGKLHKHEEDLHDVTRQWFNENLEKPTRFTASKPPFYRKPNKAISWFKDTAAAHISHIRDLVGILENHGISVQMLKSERVGYVVYEDEVQIVAEPFGDSY